MFWFITNNNTNAGYPDYGAGNFFNNTLSSPVWIIIAIVFLIMAIILTLFSYHLLIKNKDTWKFTLINACFMAIISIIAIMLGL